MASVTTDSLDVSCRATAHAVYSFLLNNRPASCLVEGLPYSLAHLQNVSASITWDQYLLFLRNCHNLLSENEWVEQCTNFTDSPYLRSMLAMAGVWLSPRNCMAWGLGARGNLVGTIFRCLQTTSLNMTRHECQVEYQLPSNYSIPPNYFWQSLSCGFVGATAALGLAPVVGVTWELCGRGARFTIPLPRRSFVRFLRMWISSLVNRDFLRYARLNHKYLQDREHWLQLEITKRIESEQALRESEEQLRVLMESAPEAILVCDVDEDRIVSANGKAEILFCLSEYSLLELSLFSLVCLPTNETSQQNRHPLQIILEQVLSGRTAVFEFCYKSPNGRDIPCEARLVRLPSTKKLLVRASITDISTRKQAEAELVKARDAAVETAAKLKLREQELTLSTDRLKEAIRITNTGIFEHDHVHGTVYRSPEIQQIYGRNSEYTTHVFDFLEWVFEEDREELLQKVSRAHDPKFDGQFQHLHRMNRPDGEMIWCEAHATTFFEGVGDERRAIRTVGAVVDVTERITREKLLKNSQQYLQAIIESTSDIVFSLDRELRYLAFNRHHLNKMKEVYGVEICIGGCILDFLLVDADRAIFIENSKRALLGEVFQAVQPYGDVALLRSSFEVTFNPIRGEAGGVTGFAVFARDTSQQIRAQNALKESEELQRLAIEISELGIWKFNTQTRKFTLDARSQQLFGFHQSTISEAELESRIHPDDLHLVLDNVKLLYKPDGAGIFKMEHRVLTPSGCRWMTVCGTRLEKHSSAGGNAELEFIGTLMDVTERVQTSNLLSQSLSEKDAMLKEIHHRVKNNLQVISSLLSLQAGEDPSDEVREFSHESQRRVRAMALVHETLYQSETLAKIDMAQYVKQLCDNLIQSYGPDQAVIVRAVDDLQLELDFALPIGLILSELIANALKHAFRHRSTPGHISINLDFPSSRRVLSLTVSDDGIGLPSDLSIESQTSFGLKLVRLLTKQLHATMTISSTAGASFMIEVPYD